MFETREEIRKAAVEKAIKKEFAKLSRRLRESLEPYKDKLDVDDVVRRTFHVDR